MAYQWISQQAQVRREDLTMPDFERKHIKLISEPPMKAIIGTEPCEEYDRKGWFPKKPLGSRVLA
jgi:hypothetical protein